MLISREVKTAHANPMMSSEEMEMEKIKELRQVLVQRRKQAAQSCAKALVAVRCEPVISSHPLTHPKEFNFATDARVKSGKDTEVTSHPEGAAWKEVDFVSELRKRTD